MKFIGLGGIIVGVLVLLLMVSVFGLWIYGLVLGFHSGLLVGLLHLLIPPLSVFTGGIDLITGHDVSIDIAKIITNLSN